MKSYLRGNDGSFFPLAPKVTTIGKEGCDIILQYPSVDCQHAVIEYSEQEDCLVLQDLNTTHGTYVNDVRIQNAAVRLATGDIIKFGQNGLVMELQTENYNAVNCPPVQQRPAWTQPLTMITDQQQGVSQLGNGPLPYLSTGTATFTMPSTVWTPAPGGQQLPPRPPQLRTRPLSAGSNRRTSIDRLQTLGGSPIGSAQSPVIQRSVTGSWVNTVSNKMLVGSPRGPSPIPQQSLPQHIDINSLQEKEQRIIQLTEEVNRLHGLELDSYRKDQQLQQLKQEVGDLQSRLSHPNNDYIQPGRDAEFTQKLLELENELLSKKNEINMLREQISRMKADNPESPAHMKEEINEKVREMNHLRVELERMKKDKNITSGLVTQMQKDMSSKDSSISKLSREIESCRKEIRERDNQMAAMNAKITRLKDNTKFTEERDAREKELISLRQRFKSAENKNQEQQDLIDGLREELEKSKTHTFEDKDLLKQLQNDVETGKAELLDIQRAERVVRVDLEQASKQLERFRNRIIQVTYSSPDLRTPETAISDDMLIDTLANIVAERTQYMRQIQDLENEVKSAETNSDTFKHGIQNLRSSVRDIINGIQKSGHLSASLKQQIRLLQSITADDSVAWIPDLFISLLENELQWEQDLETSLENCGVNVKVSSDSPAEHIKLLYAKWESALTERDRLKFELTRLNQQHKEELELHLGAEKQNTEALIREAVERTKLEGEERFNKALDEIKCIEAEKREKQLAEERKKTEELQITIEQMRQNLQERQEEEREKLNAAENAVVQLRTTETTVLELREELQQLTLARDQQVEGLQSELNGLMKKGEDSVQSYKEQVRQHSVTICAMEERLNKVMKKNREYQDEISNLRKDIDEKSRLLKTASSKPALPPKPKVKVKQSTDDVDAMHQVILLLRRENAELKLSVQDQGDVILGLRKDLEGATARLSDISGEMSEAQKQEIEQTKDLLAKRELDLTEVRQQLATLSKIVDKQKQELQALESELSKEKSVSAKIRGHIDEKAERLKCLEDQLMEDKENQKRRVAVIDQEGRITSELTSVGAQCRGERHGEVIMRQREALTELRNRIKNLEIAKPPLPSQDSALQQVIMLKKELAEMKATQALAEDVNIQNVTSLDREVIRARGKLSAPNPEVDLERSAHRETMDALESSENSFLTLLRAMASCLEMEDIEGLRAISHLPSDERERLCRQREQSCELLANRIKILREKVSRKEDLLQGYERDLAKMRQAQELELRKAGQVDNLTEEIRAKTEESQYLRECLNKTRDMLEQEKRLNTAIKQKKTFHMENERVPMTSPGSHRCRTNDPLGKEAARRRAQRELAQRKNYEIKTLKNQLTEKERMLYDKQNRLYTLETSMGLESSA